MLLLLANDQANRAAVSDLGIRSTRRPPLRLSALLGRIGGFVFGQNEVVPTSRAVIENRLLAALEDDSSKVAIIASEQDLVGLIAALEDSIGYGPVKDALRLKWIDDLRQLREASFG